MRTRKEVLFRLRQEAGNIRLRLQRVRPVEAKGPLPPLPAPGQAAAAVRGTAYAEALAETAEAILQHRFPLLGLTVETGKDIEWRRDYCSGIASPARYFRFISYLDAGRVGDHKVIWELNRHQHWVALAQGFLLTGRREFLEEIERQFSSWVSQNPFQRGINWASALEVAFRALSWTWVFHLAGEALAPEFLRRLASWLYRHGLYLERNLSIYFSPNTHLLGEAVALHALGVLFPAFPRARAWAAVGGRIVREQMDGQVHPDGSHFEQSSYYHVYALDMFLFHAALAETPSSYREKLELMADYLAGLLGPARRLHFLGDDDGGRFFHPYGARDRFGRATLATAAALLGRDWGASEEDACEQAVWWVPGRAEARRRLKPAPQQSRYYPDAGVAVMTSGGVHILVDAGSFGAGSAGHSHSDTLSIAVRAGDQDVLVDPGTYTYVADSAWRDRFRGSAMHNTVRIAGRDQAVPAGPFRWLEKPRVELREWNSNAAQDYLDATCSYGGFSHRRRMAFFKPGLVVIVDDVEGSGRQLVEQFWHVGCEGLLVFAALEPERIAGGEYGWRSDAFGIKRPAPVLRLSQNAALPVRFATVLDLSLWHGLRRLSLLAAPAGACYLLFESQTSSIIRFAQAGPPACALL